MGAASAILMRFGSVAWRILRISIPVPLAIVLAAALWWQFDKASAIRRAVDAKVKEIVAGADIAAAESERDAALALARARERLAADLEARLAAERQAAADFQSALDEAQRINTELQGQIDAILGQPVPADCLVDGPFLDRLR